MATEDGSWASHTLLLQNDVVTPLGCLRLAGEIIRGHGVEPASEMRVYGRYAVVCLLNGSGRYQDIHGTRRTVNAGDAILVFPELGHHYGPNSNNPWDEFYVTFDGPIFDLWRQCGLLDVHTPIHTVPMGDWKQRLRTLVTDSSLMATAEGRLEQINRFVLLLGELLRAGQINLLTLGQPEWVRQAQAAMDINLGAEVNLNEIAVSLGMSYETFRKRFLQVTGATPTRYRLHRRVAAACELLRYSPQMTNRQAAEILGFADEFHFSRRFTQVAGITPRDFRQKKPLSSR